MREDLRHAFRSLIQAPTFTIVAIVVLTLGIGATTAIFSVVDAVVLRGLPFDQHDRLAVVLEYETKRADTFASGSTTMQTFLDWREQQRSFEKLAVVSFAQTFRLKSETGEPLDARFVRVSHDFFDVLRVRPAAGRTFTPEEESHGR